ncbi:chromosome segregation ATPase [Egbenema bharatensis]|uniref:chromosome segregation ATPase n=1 Tax=Egbenema bharatensis TaxID=3463334 RepID=UPI003A847FD5
MTEKRKMPDCRSNGDGAKSISGEFHPPGIPPFRVELPPHPAEAKVRPAVPIASTTPNPYAASRADDHAEAQDPAVSPVSPTAQWEENETPFEVPVAPKRFFRRWQFWGITSIVAFSGLGILSALTLLRLPSLPNCPTIFWPTASASLRIYCAQLSAERRTVDDLLKAISLVNALPDDHPLRPKIDRNIEIWAKDILDLGEESFHRGDLQQAIKTAQSIPDNTEVHQLVEDQIQSWQAIWTEAEGIYDEAEAFLYEHDLRQAFRVATRLLDVRNEYWRTTKYRELNQLITLTREDSNKLGRAQDLARQGGLNNLLAAIQLAEEVTANSPLHAKAQRHIAEFGQSMIDLAQETLDQRDYMAALNILEQVPDQPKLQEKIKDFKILAEAQAQAWSGTPDDIQGAIARVQRIGRDRPLYSRAQHLISRWRLEIQDVQRLAIARQVAQGGTTADLRAAISEARLIPASNPRGDEAQQIIDEWTTTIQTVEDRPYLTRAQQLAGRGDINALQSAINEASRVGSGRALYAEAQDQIGEWRSQIQRIQDRPILDRARLLANSGNLVEAISVAEQIASGRALYDEAQGEIQAWTGQFQRIQDQPLLDLARRYASQGNVTQAINVAEQISAGRTLYDEAQGEIQLWQTQFQGEGRIQQAQSAASVGTPAMLLTAIQIANEIPADNSARAEADRLISQWSWRILEIAESQLNLDPTSAINIARSIPSYTEAYPTAQQQIQTWQQSAPRLQIP